MKETTFEKMAKKGRDTASEKTYMIPLFSNTTCSKRNHIMGSHV